MLTSEQTALIQAYATNYDSSPEHAQEQYEKGLAHAQVGYTILITQQGTWTIQGAHLTTCETLGWHAHTKDLLRGWIEGGAPLLDQRIEAGLLTCKHCCTTSAQADWQAQNGKCPRCKQGPALPTIPNFQAKENDTHGTATQRV